jgi:GNAT superfamily N-acetyltransferase
MLLVGASVGELATQLVNTPISRQEIWKGKLCFFISISVPSACPPKRSGAGIDEEVCVNALSLALTVPAAPSIREASQHRVCICTIQTQSGRITARRTAPRGRDAPTPMLSPLTDNTIRTNPDLASFGLQHPALGRLCFRPLQRTEAGALGAYFAALSPETRRRFAPHPFDQATADALCLRPSPDVLRLVAVPAEAPAAPFLAYVILRLGVTGGERRRFAVYGQPIWPETDCTVAPSVADAWQGQGLGTRLMTLVCDLARQLGRRRMLLMGGTQADNARAVALYRRLGFQTAGEFEHPAGVWNYDMLKPLTE